MPSAEPHRPSPMPRVARGRRPPAPAAGQGVHGEVGPSLSLDHGGARGPPMSGFRQLGIAGECTRATPVPAATAGRHIAMELARVDPSPSFGVRRPGHGLHLPCASNHEERRLPEMARMEKIGRVRADRTRRRFGRGGGLTTHCRRDGTEGALDGRRGDRQRHLRRLRDRSGARSPGGRAGQGSVVEKGTPGFEDLQAQDKSRAAGGAERAHHPGRGPVPEENRLQRADSFSQTAEALARDPAGVAWRPPRARGAYEHARPTPASASARPPIGGFQLVQDLLAGARSRRRPACARLSALQQAGGGRGHHSAWPRRSPSGCETAAWPASCSAGTASCWRTTWAGSSPTPRPMTPPRAPEISTPDRGRAITAWARSSARSTGRPAPVQDP